MPSTYDLSPTPVHRLLGRMFSFFKRRFCSHAFRLADLKMVNPDGPKRVAWKCYKCGEILTGHCGLDISPKHGPIHPPNVNDQRAAKEAGHGK
jgi:hypothetical protein